jgi:ferredoxin
MISILEAIVAAGSSRPIWFIHGARNRRDQIMGAFARRIVTEHDNVRLHVCYSRPDPADLLGRDYDSAGRVTIDLVQRLLPRGDFDFYLCGPEPFMKALHDGLLAWSVPEARIHYEHFGPPTVLKPVKPQGLKASPTSGVDALHVSFARSGLTVAWDSSAESLLDLAELHGLRPDFSCRSGICHTCMSKLVEVMLNTSWTSLTNPTLATCSSAAPGRVPTSSLICNCDASAAAFAGVRRSSHPSWGVGALGISVPPMRIARADEVIELSSPK